MVDSGPLHHREFTMEFEGIFGSGGAAAIWPPLVRAVEMRNGVCIMRLQGNVGREAARDAQKTIDEADRVGLFHYPLLLDFAGTSGSDFATVAHLVNAVRRRKDAHARVGILHAPAELRTQLEISKVEGLLGMYEDEGEAVRALSEPKSAG
ncbi:MAG: STAS domain-containing protein [Phycisphaeraceae bacterium]|nr:STAS domain-containing protein [Phycisphaeraceae bacterium]